MTKTEITLPISPQNGVSSDHRVGVGGMTHILTYAHLRKRSPAPESQDPHLRGSSGRVHRRPPSCPSNSTAASVETMASAGRNEGRHGLLHSRSPYSDPYSPGKHLIQIRGLVSREWKNRQESRLVRSPVTTKCDKMRVRSKGQVGRERQTGRYTQRREKRKKQTEERK